jgi:DNA repair and recombination RAD54-like protein
MSQVNKDKDRNQHSIHSTPIILISCYIMLRRLPQSKPGDQPVTSATSGGYGIVCKPYKPPSALAPTRTLAIPGRKRKAVSYKEQGGEGKDDDDGDASDGEPKKKKGTFEMGNKVYGDDGVLGDMAKWCNRKFPVFEKKDRTVVFAKG